MSWASVIAAILKLGSVIISLFNRRADRKAGADAYKTELLQTEKEIKQKQGQAAADADVDYNTLSDRVRDDF